MKKFLVKDADGQAHIFRGDHIVSIEDRTCMVFATDTDGKVKDLVGCFSNFVYFKDEGLERLKDPKMNKLKTNNIGTIKLELQTDGKNKVYLDSEMGVDNILEAHQFSGAHEDFLKSVLMDKLQIQPVE